MKTFARVSIVALILGGGLVPLTATAALPGSSEKVTVEVSYADLNIRNDAGARVLYARLRAASNDVCGLDSARKSRALEMISKARACFKETLDASVAKVDSEMLNEIHTG